MQNLSCSKWYLAPWSDIKPRAPALGARSLGQWTTRKGPTFVFFLLVLRLHKTYNLAHHISLLQIYTQQTQELWQSLFYVIHKEKEIAYLIIAFTAISSVFLVENFHVDSVWVMRMNTLLITGDLAQARFSPCVPRASSLPPPNYFTCRLPSPEAPHHPSCVTRTSSLPSQFSPVTQSCPTLCDPMECSTPGFRVHHQLPELAQTHVHWVGDTIQPSHPLSSPSPPAFNLSQHQGLFKWVSSLHQVAKVLELQHQSFQWIFRTDFL